MQVRLSYKSTTKIIQLLGSDAIEIQTPDYKVLKQRQEQYNIERKSCEQKADEFYKSTINEIEENKDETRKIHYENIIKQIRREILKTLSAFKNYKFSDHISHFIVQQGTGDIAGEIVFYQTKYEESYHFQEAYKYLSLMQNQLNKIRELFNEHNNAIDILAKINSRLTIVEKIVLLPHHHKCSHLTEGYHEKKSSKESEIDFLFHCDPGASLRRQKF